ncbi:ABC transporter permease [Streptomyces sp. NBC_00344]|uniref:ABC transporter permease n=1 Tax=Streptomyces sp. NBC_00344 TaxID=2975720 RepID=UPI002E21D3D2
MKKPPVAHAPWIRLCVISVSLPMVIMLAVLAFAWPAGRIAPRDLPVGIVGANAAGQQAVEGLAHSKPGGFDFHLYSDEGAARSAIRQRDVYGAFVVTPGDITVLEASAAGPAVAQLLGTAGQQLRSHASQQAAASAHAKAAGTGSHRAARGGAAGAGRSTGHPPANISPPKVVHVKTVDVVATSADDPRGLVFSSALLPLTICGVIIAAAIALLPGFRAAWHRVVALPVVCAVAGLGVHLVAQGFLGALPHETAATWGALSLTLLAISATTAGLVSVVGPAGFGLGAALMVFVGNPFSGVTSAPQLLPKAVGSIGQWLPPGAGASLLRSTAYFNGNGSAEHLAVLALWGVLGLAATLLGRRAPAGSAPAPAGSTPAPEGTQATWQTLPDDLPGTQAQTQDAGYPHARHAYGTDR